MEKTAVFNISIEEDVVLRLAREEVKRILSDLPVTGTWWDMKRLEEETSRKRDWLLDNILLNPSYREDMQMLSNKCTNGRWLFKGEAMRKFLDEHFHELNTKPKRMKA